MKSIIKLRVLFFVIICCFCGIIVINATELPDNLSKITQAGLRLFDSSCGASDSDGDGSPDCYGMAVKWSETTGANICTQYNKISPALGEVSCTKNDNWTPEVRYAIAKLIQASGISYDLKQADANYFAAELAINQFLNEKSAGGEAITGVMTSTYSTLYNNYLSVAQNANYGADSNVDITLSATELSFTLNGSNYESNSIKISEGSDFTVTTSVGTVIKELDSFKIIVPSNSLNAVTSVKATVTRSKTLPQARNYTCGSYQTLTPVALEDITKSNKKEISGTITPLGKLIINKVDENNNPVIGATILVTSRTDDNFKKTFVTDGNPIVLEGLMLGKYSIDEEVVPSGYLKAEGKIVVLSETNITETINLVDKFTKISILKIDENEKSLSAVKLKLLDKDSKSIDVCKDKLGNKVSCEWTTTDKAYDIYNLPVGIYYIKEESVPQGYDINPNKIKVEILATGEVKVDGKKVNDGLIKILNNLTRTEISKISAVNGNELPGATLQILDKDGKSIACIIKTKDGKNETLKECKWVSGEEPKIVLGLSSGSYYLEETIAPEGYELNKNRVEFKIKADGSITKVEMKNELLVKVPDTLSARSTLLIAISMFDIALGIGIITYVKKNKIKE